MDLYSSILDLVVKYAHNEILCNVKGPRTDVVYDTDGGERSPTRGFYTLYNHRTGLPMVIALDAYKKPDPQFDNVPLYRGVEITIVHAPTGTRKVFWVSREHGNFLDPANHIVKLVLNDRKMKQNRKALNKEAFNKPIKRPKFNDRHR